MPGFIVRMVPVDKNYYLFNQNRNRITATDALFCQNCKRNKFWIYFANATLTKATLNWRARLDIAEIEKNPMMARAINDQMMKLGKS
jgi:hypothetical protein